MSSINFTPPCSTNSSTLPINSQQFQPPSPSNSSRKGAALSHLPNSLTPIPTFVNPPPALTSNSSVPIRSKDPLIGYGKIARRSSNVRYSLFSKDQFTKNEWDFLPPNRKNDLLKDKDAQIKALQEKNRALQDENQTLQIQKERAALAEDAAATSHGDELDSSSSSSSSSHLPFPADGYGHSLEESSLDSSLDDVSSDADTAYNDDDLDSSSSSSHSLFSSGGQSHRLEEFFNDTSLDDVSSDVGTTCNDDKLDSSTFSSPSSSSSYLLFPDDGQSHPLEEFFNDTYASLPSSTSTQSSLQAGSTLSSSENNSGFSDLQEKLQTIKRLKRENIFLKTQNIKIKKSYQQKVGKKQIASPPTHAQNKEKPTPNVLVSEEEPKNLIFLTETELFKTDIFKTTCYRKRYQLGRKFLQCAKMSQAIAIELLINNPLLSYEDLRPNRQYGPYAISGFDNTKGFLIQSTFPFSTPKATYTRSLRDFSFPSMGHFSQPIPYVLLQTSRASLGHYLLIKDVNLFSNRSGGGCLSGRVVHVSINSENQDITLTPTHIQHKLYPHNHGPLGLLGLSQEKLLTFLKSHLADKSITIENIPTKEKTGLSNISVLNLAASNPLIEIS